MSRSASFESGGGMEQYEPDGFEIEISDDRS